MERCDFSSISTCLKNQISESNQMNQPDFLYELFEDFMNDPINEDFSMDNGLICRWITGQAKISPKITSYYAKPSNQKKLATTIQRNLLPLMADCNMVIQDIYTLFIQDDTISDTKKQELVSLYKPSDSRLLFLAKVLSFGMERQFIKRDTRNQKLIAGGVLSPIVLDYIMDMDFIDDPPEISEQERFQRHNRFLRSLKSDTLLIIDNFNVTSTQDSCLSVVLKYRCRVLFTTRSQLSEYCSFQLKELKDIPTLFQLTSVFYSEAEENRAIVEKIIETVHYHTFAVELAAKLLENGILTPEQLLIKLQEEKASLHNEDKIKVMKDGQSKKATYYNHIHTLFSLYSLSRKQQDIMCNMCFMPSSGISARIFSKWLELPTLNDVNDLIETGFVQSSLRHTISLHPMIQEIAVSETAPSVTSCHTLLDSLQKICLMHGIEVSYYKKLFQTVENIMLFIEKDDIPQYLLFLEDVFPYMEKYHYQKGMKKIIQELQHFIKANTYGTASDRALLLDYQATLEPKTEKAIKLEKEALAQIKETTKENAHLVSNLHSNLGGLYRINGQLDLAKRHMKMGISLLQQYQLLYTNDSIPQINNYAVLLIEIQEPDLALSALQKLAQIIKEYNSNHCLDYAQVQESLGSICLITANISQAKTHFKKALKIYEDIWADEPELIEEKYQAIQELYPQAGIALAKSILLTKH